MSKFLKVVLLVVAMLLLISGNASARFISEQEARIVVKNWLDMTPTETLSIEGTEIREVMHFVGEPYGNPGYYAVLLNPSGWVIVPAHDSFEAIIAFGQGSFTREEYARSPLATLIQIDVDEESFLRGRSAVTRQEATQDNARAERWQILSRLSTVNRADIDVVVEPILRNNMWDQGNLRNAAGEFTNIPYFNLHTSRESWESNRALEEWESHTYLAGCGAVAMAQLMTVFRYPSGPPISGTLKPGHPFGNIITTEMSITGFRVLEDIQLDAPILDLGRLGYSDRLSRGTIVSNGFIAVPNQAGRYDYFSANTRTFRDTINSINSIIIITESPAIGNISISDNIQYDVGLRLMDIYVHLRGGESVGRRVETDPLVGYNWDWIVDNVRYGTHNENLTPGHASRHYEIRNEIASLLHDTGVLLGSTYMGTRYTPNFTISEAVFSRFYNLPI